MADFTAPSWLFPKEGAWESFVKGSQAGAAIAANRIRAKAAYADIRQTQQRLELAERAQVTHEQAADLENQVKRTKLTNDAEDFATLREWWPKFQAAEGDIEMPNLHDDNTMLKVATAVAQKQSKMGMAEFAKFMSAPGRDLSKDEDQKEYFDLVSQYKNIPDKLGPDGIMAPIKMAESLKRLRDETDSRIDSRASRSYVAELEAERKQLLADSTVDLNSARIQELNSKIALANRGMVVKEESLEVAQRRQDLNELLADHTIPLTDAKVKEAQSRLNLAERNMLVKESQAKSRATEIANKAKKSIDQSKWSAVDMAEYNHRAKVAEQIRNKDEADRAIQEIREDIEAKRLVRESYKTRAEKLAADKAGATAIPTTGTEQLGPRRAIPTAGAEKLGPKEARDLMPKFPAMPSNKADLEVDEVYMTPMGPLRWNGKKFVSEE